MTQIRAILADSCSCYEQTEIFGIPKFFFNSKKGKGGEGTSRHNLSTKPPLFDKKWVYPQRLQHSTKNVRNVFIPFTETRIHTFPGRASETNCYL